MEVYRASYRPKASLQPIVTEGLFYESKTLGEL